MKFSIIISIIIVCITPIVFTVENLTIKYILVILQLVLLIIQIIMGQIDY